MDHSRLLVWVDDQGRERPVKTRDEWRRRREHILLGMQAAMGEMPDRTGLPAPSAEVVASLENEGYARQTLRIKAELDDDFITAYLYLPKSLKPGERRAAVLALHQTHALGKGDVDEVAGRANLRYASELARRGYVVLAPDYPSFGDLKDYDFAADRYVSGTMKGILNHVRCVDYLVSRPEVDAARLGVIGHSLGGHNAMFVAAFDERLKVVVSSCGWTPFHDYYGGKIEGWTSDRYMPRLRDAYGLDPDKVPFDFYEVVAALAPRAFFSSSPLHDENFDVNGVRKAEAEARKVFELLGAGKNLRVVYPDCGHDFPPEVRREAYAFIDRALGHEPAAPEPDLSAELRRARPLEPEQALKSLQTLDGFRAELVAAEPLIESPVAMAFDEDGRLYVVEMRDYSEHPEERLGRVKLLEDTQGDGRMDKSTVFAEGLSWPTAVICWDGGVFVAAAPDIFYLKDTDGDGRADAKKVVFTGFGRSNVQGLLNSFRWGLDNRIYGATSSSGGEVRRPDEPDANPVNLRGRDFAFDPRTLEIEAVSGGGQHGMCFDDWGTRFVCSNSDHIQMIAYEDRHASRNPGVTGPPPRVSIAADSAQAEVFRVSPVEPWRRVRTRLRVSGQAPGPIEGGGRAAGYFTSATGITVYRGDAWPPEYRGQVFVADVGSNLIHRKRLETNGVIYTARRVDEKREFLASTDNWFRPVQMSNGPDGNLWVIDMYREVIEHPASLPPIIKKHLDLDSGRDRGRIYRIISTTERSVRLPSADRGLPLGQKSTRELVAFLRHPSAWQRETAARLLYQRQDPAAVEPLERLRASDQPLGRLHALYALHGLGSLKEDHLIAALHDRHPNIVEHALELSRSLPVTDVILTMAMELTDPSTIATPRMRYRLALSVGQWDSHLRLPVLVRQLYRPDDMDDPRIRYAVLSSLGADTSEAILRASSIHPTAGSISAGLYMDLARGIPAERIEAFILSLRWDEGVGFHFLVLSGLVERHGRALIRETFRKIDPERGPQKYDRVLSRALKDASEDHPLSERLRAVRALCLGNFERVRPALGPLVRDGRRLELQRAALAVLDRFTEPAVAEVLLEALPQAGPAIQSALVTSLLSRASRTVALLDAIVAGRVPRSVLTPAQLAGLGHHPDATVRQRAAALAGVSGKRRDIVERYRSEVASLTGDPTRGKSVFAATCATCHKAGEAGVELGPSLMAFVARGKDVFIANVLDPDAEVGPQFVNYVVTTTDGRVLAGLISSETATAVTITAGGGESQTVRREQIVSLVGTGQSLMPVGLESTVTPQAMADLHAYLTSLAVEQAK